MKSKNLSVSHEYISQWLPSIRDVSQITAQLPAIWNTIESIVNIEGLAISNATFDLSRLLHADCQMIVGDAIVDIRTSAKRRPFTLNNFYQQLSYLLSAIPIIKVNQLKFSQYRQKV